MPMTPLPAAFICLRTAMTVAGSASIRMPSGLMRARSMSTQGVAAASCSAGSVWHETPCARMTPLSFAADSTSIAPAHSVVQVPLCLLCSSTMSIMSMPSSRRKRSRSACAADALCAAVLVSTTTFSRPTWRIASAMCGCAP